MADTTESKKLVWDTVGERFFETGIDKVVLYPQDASGKYPKGYAWSGVTSISESPSGAEPTALYADNIKYLNLMSNEELGATIEAYYSPAEFDECDGSAQFGVAGVKIGQQPRKAFGLSYRSNIGSDTKGNDAGYKIHLLYGCLASPSEKQYQTINDSPEAATMSWELTTTPVAVGGNFKPTSLIVIDTTKVASDKLDALQAALWGTDTDDAYLPLPSKIMEILTGTSEDEEETGDTP